MRIRLAVFVALLAVAPSFLGDCFAQILRPKDERGGAPQAGERDEFQLRVRTEIERLKAENPRRYVETVDFAVDPRAYADKRVAVLGLGDVAPVASATFTVRIADSYGGTPAITADCSRLDAEAKKALRKIGFPPHALLVAGVWRETADGWRLIADELRDLGAERFESPFSAALDGPGAAAVRAGQDERLRRLSAELRRLKAETPRRYVENSGFNSDPGAYAEKRVVAVGFGNFSSNVNGTFTVRIADSYGGLPAITADFSALGKETKRTLLKSNAPPHVLLIAGVWRKTPAGWRLFAEEARDFGEARCGTLSDCLKTP